jgi:hypothetical protein
MMYDLIYLSYNTPLVSCIINFFPLLLYAFDSAGSL